MNKMIACHINKGILDLFQKFKKNNKKELIFFFFSTIKYRNPLHNYHQFL